MVTKRKQLKRSNKYVNKNARIASKRVAGVEKINAMRDRMQRRRR